MGASGDFLFLNQLRGVHVATIVSGELQRPQESCAMEGMGRAVLVLSIALASGCAIDASGLGAADATAVDGSAPTRTDASFARRDAGRDAAPGMLDAMAILVRDADLVEPPASDAGPSCIAIDESCNGVDDDCDGTVDESGCPCDVGTHADHVYLACTGESRSFGEAQSFCASLGYDLVVIEDAAENEAVRLRIDNDSWIGLHDRATEGDYVWVDGTTPGYLNWRPGDAPRGTSQPTYDCVEMDPTTGEWLDVGCGGGRPFVCETDPDR